MATNSVLSTTAFTFPSAYIGQIITPAPALVPDTRLPCYIGRGSRFAVAKNQAVTRSFVPAEVVTFSPTAPYLATLAHAAANQKAHARLVKQDGNEVKASAWNFVKNQTTNKYDQITLTPEVFDPNATYTLTYQSLDRTVPDVLPVADIRAFLNVGNGPDAPDYDEYVDYYADFSVVGDELATDPLLCVPDPLNTNRRASIDAPVAGGSNGNGVNATVTLAASAAFTHNYNRFYTLKCISSASTTDATFEWSAQPVSAGNDNLPPVPLDLSVAKPQIVLPTVAVDTTTAVTLELGVVVAFRMGTVTTGGFIPGDTWTINAKGPALIEIDPRLSNTNQYCTPSAIVKAAGTGRAGLAYDTTSDPVNAFNAKFKVEVVAATDTSVKSALSVKRNSNTDGLTLTAKVGGVAGNSIVLSFLDPGIANSPLTVTGTATSLTVVLATNATSHLVSTLADVNTKINATASSPVSSVTVGSSSTIMTPVLSGTANVTNGAATVTAGVGSLFSTEMRPGSRVKFSSQPGTVYTVVASPAPSATTFSVDPVYSGTTKLAGANLTGTVTTTTGSAAVVGAATLFTTELAVGDRVKFSTDDPHVYVVATIADTTHLTLTSPFLGTGAALLNANLAGVDVTVVSEPMTTGSGANGAFTAKVAWAEYGERVGVSGTADLTYTQATPATAVKTVSMSSGVVLAVDFSTGPLAVGDTFTLSVAAPRLFYQAKDDRVTTLTTDTINPQSIGGGSISGSYTTNTIEGGSGLGWSAADNNVSPSDTAWKHGAFVLPGNLLLNARNLHTGPTTAATANQHVTTNKFTFSATLAGTINWSLIAKKTETIAKAQILTDVVGKITGVAGSPYLILSNVPDQVLSVINATSKTAISTLASPILTALGDPTQYISFLTKPTEDVKVQYTYRGKEPTPGQTYYVSTKHVRPTGLLNTPILINSLEIGRALLAPSEVDNHLYIMNEIAMGDVGAPGIYIVQVHDSDGDGAFTDLDFKDAIVASESPRAISDLIVLSHFSSLTDQLNSLNRMADPFKRRLRMGWIGAPTPTLVGSEDESGSLVNLSKRVLQVYGNNPAHGTRVLVGATYATRELLLDNGVTEVVDLDGSFVAGALAALVASFSVPSATVLRQQLAGFKTIQTYGDAESPDNMVLGAANVIPFLDLGAGIYQIMLAVTTDTFAPDFSQINAMTQKMYVTKQVRTELDSKLIGLVVPSAEAGVGLIKSFLVQELLMLQGRGLIGNYAKADGSERPLDPSKDVVVFRDSSDPGLYHIVYNYFLFATIERIFGLYSIDRADMSA